jgi:hypothetical protein
MEIWGAPEVRSPEDAAASAAAGCTAETCVALGPLSPVASRFAARLAARSVNGFEGSCAVPALAWTVPGTVARGAAEDAMFATVAG